MSPKTGHFYEFGDFRLDPSAKVLFCEDKPVSLTPKVFDTLQFFVEHAGSLLEKDELMQKIWPDRFVEESNLTFNVKMLRRALKDDAHEPRFIETVPRRGYRFIAEVKETTAEIVPNPDSIRIGSVGSLATSRSKYWTIAMLAVFVSGSVIFAVRFGLRRYVTSARFAPILSAPSKSEKFSNFSSAGSLQAVITPDGKYVAFTSENEGKQSIWLRKLETSENIQIVPPSDNYFLGLAVSHDGNSLYFVRQSEPDQSPSELYRVMTFGGIPVKIAEKTEGWISVSPDDKQISFVRCGYKDDDFCSLFVAGADGRNERRVLTRQRPIRIADNQFSPDGQSIAFAAGQTWNGGSDFRLFKVNLAGGAESEISPKTFFYIRNLKWLPKGDGLLLTAKEKLDGRIRIWQVLTGTGEALAVTKDATDYENISIDKTADKMIATEVSNNFRLYLVSTQEFNKPKALTAARNSFTFAPDGRIVYSGNDGNIWTINRDGGEQRQLTNNSFTNFSPRISPDNRYIFFSSNRTGANQVWRMNADGSNQIQITKTEGGHPRFVTKDGHWLYFWSGVHQTIWRVSTDGGQETQVWDLRVSIEAFSPDGHLFAYFFRDRDHNNRVRIGVTSVENQSVVKYFDLLDDTSSPIMMVWTVDSRSLNYITEKGSKHSLWLQTPDNDKPNLIAELGADEIEAFEMAPDGGSLGFIRGGWIHEMVLIEGLE